MDLVRDEHSIAGELIGTVIDWDALGIEPDRIMANSQRIKGRIKPVPRAEENAEQVALVGYGASLNTTWPLHGPVSSPHVTRGRRRPGLARLWLGQRMCSAGAAARVQQPHRVSGRICAGNGGAV